MSIWTIAQKGISWFQVKDHTGLLTVSIAGNCIHSSFTDKLANAAIEILSDNRKPANAKESPLPATVWRKEDGWPYDFLSTGVYMERQPRGMPARHHPISYIINSGEFSTSPEGLPEKKDWVEEAIRDISTKMDNTKLSLNYAQEEIIADIIRKHAPKS